MALSVMLPQPPNNTPINDANGFLSADWRMWIQQLYQRVGGANALSNVSLNNTGPQTTPAATPIGLVNTTILTSPLGKTTVIDSFVVSNPTLGDITVSLYVVPLDGTPDSTNLIFQQVISPLSSQTKTVSLNVGGGGTFVGIASAINATVTQTQRSVS